MSLPSTSIKFKVKTRVYLNGAAYITHQPLKQLSVLPETNTLAYSVPQTVTKKKCFATLCYSGPNCAALQLIFIVSISVNYCVGCADEMIEGNKTDYDWGQTAAQCCKTFLLRH